MYPRLALLKEMLREDGAIFVSIDDTEVHHLRMMMDEIFGVENFVACVCWQKKYSASNDHQGVAPMHDFLLAYQKSDDFKRNLLPRTHQQDRAYKNPDDDPRGSWKPADYTCNKTKEERPNLYYAILNPHTEKEVWPDEKRVWAYSEDITDENLKDNRLWWGKDGTNSTPALKNFLTEVQGGLVPTTWWPQEDVGHTDEAKKEVQRILGTPAATMTPKPVDLLRRVIRVAAGKEDLVLDSFAGTGTTGHAALALNQEDGGNRRFVLVQMPFDTKEQQAEGLNICDKLAAERVRKVIKGYTYAKPRRKTEQVPGLGGSFTYARLGRRLFGEYRDLGDDYPAYDELAKYIFYTETSRDFDAAAVNRKTGRIGEHQGTAYYLLYTPDPTKEIALDAVWLKEVGAKEKCRKLVVYCEKLWLHRNDLLRWQEESKHDVRPMLVPFNLK